ncbi:MAG: LUD domain-containing protein [Bifidobacteriaceae bacterium]|nr:LUD domain-containing protein [Bifidobacteriaceae bacterium]
MSPDQPTGQADAASRQRVLATITGALSDVSPGPEPERTETTAEKISRPAGPAASGDVIGLFAERCADYGATVVRLSSGRATAEAARMLVDRGVRRIALPAGLLAEAGPALTNSGIEIVKDDPPLASAELDQLDGVVTACRVAIAETGTLVLDHSVNQGRRALTLVPDLHLCLVRGNQVVPDVPQAISRLYPSILAGLPLTWVSGPSATVDIELTRVEGVHGPRTLLVVIAE